MNNINLKNCALKKNKQKIIILNIVKFIFSTIIKISISKFI